MSAEKFPREIVAEILSWLPAKSVLRCRSVCKSWRSLISNPSFISLHRRRSESFLLFPFLKRFPFLTRNGFEYHISPLRVLTLSDSSVPLPSHLYPYCSVIATCHGLLFIATGAPHSSSFIICNPSLRRFLPLPDPRPFPQPLRIHADTFAFGFDDRNHDYKIVRIVTGVEDDRFGYSSYSRVEVYSLASGFWRTLPRVSSPFTICCKGATLCSHGFVNGLVHWGAKRKMEDQDWFFFVLSFDFGDEVFREVGLPESVARASSSSMASVTVVGGSIEKPLTVYHLIGDCPCSGSIWVMKEYGVVQSWNKLLHFDLSQDHCLRAPSLGITLTRVMDPPGTPLCVTHNSEKPLFLLDFILGKESIYLLDMENNVIANVDFGEKCCFGLISHYYAETLVLLDLDKAGSLISY